MDNDSGGPEIIDNIERRNELIPIKMVRLLKSQPNRIKGVFISENIRSGILLKFVVRLTRFARTYKP